MIRVVDGVVSIDVTSFTGRRIAHTMLMMVGWLVDERERAALAELMDALVEGVRPPEVEIDLDEAREQGEELARRQGHVRLER